MTAKSQMTGNLIIFLSVGLTTIALLSVIWIIVPAPFYNVWLYSVATSEWSLWFGLAALIGMIGTLSGRFFYGSGRVWGFSLIFGTAAFLISLYPYLSSTSTAREMGTELSFRRYFLGAVESRSAETQNFKSLTYAEVDGTKLNLDVFLPTAETANNGASVIVVHGGFWKRGERNDFPQWNAWLAGQGLTVFDIDYRLAPQPNYRAATGDVKCAVEWVKNHAEEFNISPHRIALFGRSAGGHLALLAAYSAGEAALSSSCTTANKGDQTVSAVVSLYSPTDLSWDYDHPSNPMIVDGPAEIANFMGGNPHQTTENQAQFMLASPVTHVSSKTPPTLLIHGGQDQLVNSENMQMLGAELQTAQIPFKKILIPYGQHGFDYNFYGWGSQIAQSEIALFLRENTKADR